VLLYFKYVASLEIRRPPVWSSAPPPPFLTCRRQSKIIGALNAAADNLWPAWRRADISSVDFDGQP